MATEQAKHRTYKSVVFIAAIVILAVIIVGGVYKLRSHDRNTSPTKKSDTPVASLFSFTGSPGWWQGATRRDDMALFDGNETHACFISVQHYPGIVNAATELQKLDAQVTAYDSGRTVVPLDTKSLNLEIDSGPKQYNLRQSVITVPPGTEPIKTGQEFGFMQLKDSYIKVMGLCDTPDQLPTTIAPLQAIKYSQD